MAITATNLTNGGSGTDAQSYDTASITPGSNKLILAAVVVKNYNAGSAGTVSLTGNGLTWVEIANTTFTTVASSKCRLTLLRALGASPSAGAVTISVSGSGNSSCAWAVDEFDGVDTSGTNGSGAIVQSTSDSTDNAVGDSLSLTLSALGDATNNATYCCVSNDNGRSVTPGTDYTELADQTTGQPIETQWKLPGTTTIAPGGFSSFDDAGAIFIEIKAAAGGGGTVIPVFMSQYRQRWA
jgi:hypothetical protein